MKDSEKKPLPQDLRRSLNLITMGGCLAMVFVTGTNCPAFTEFFRALGATEVHFGLIGGIPMVMLLLQFVGAAITNVIPRRKPLFVWSVIAARLLFLPIVFLPLLMGPEGGEARFWIVIALLALSSAVVNLGGPSWFSWMADLIPERVLNTYWGARQRWMYITWTLAYLGVAVFTLKTPWPVTLVFPILAVIGVAAGVVDILLFLRVDEPPNTIMRRQPVLDTLLAPIRHREFRSFLVYQCAWSASVMFAAAFMLLYTLKVLGMSTWQATLVWSVAGVGTAVASKRFGRLADRFGQKPVLAFGVGLKPLITVVFLLVTPRTALWVLPVAYLFDSMLNAGMMVAHNGYIMRIAPKENRSMFVASITGIAGLCGGLSAVAGGYFLKHTGDFSVHFLGRDWINYHLLFLVSTVLRFASGMLARRVREPDSSPSVDVLYHLVGEWPMRFLRFPVGLYRLSRGLIENVKSNLS